MSKHYSEELKEFSSHCYKKLKADTVATHGCHILEMTVIALIISVDCYEYCTHPNVLFTSSKSFIFFIR